MKLIASLLVLAACGAAHQGRATRPNDGAIAGVARDHDSGEPVAKADVHVRAEGELGTSRSVTTNAQGHYQLGHLPPGRYSLTSSFAGQPITVDHVVVARDRTAVVDLTFTLGRPDAISIDFGNAKEGAIEHYHPAHHAATTGLVEGTVNDSGSRDRVPGAVVTAALGTNEQARMAVTDDEGRYRFDDLTPGTYTISAYYSIAGRGQIEIRRSDIAVAGGDGVIVPLWIESAKQ